MVEREVSSFGARGEFRELAACMMSMLDAPTKVSTTSALLRSRHPPRFPAKDVDIRFTSSSATSHSVDPSNGSIDEQEPMINLALTGGLYLLGWLNAWVRAEQCAKHPIKRKHCGDS
jgi:hypothetical protein